VDFSKLGKYGDGWLDRFIHSNVFLYIKQPSLYTFAKLELETISTLAKLLKCPRIEK
jgi:hypothetical protein